MTGERLLLTSSTSPPPSPNGKDTTASDDEHDEKTEVWTGAEEIIEKTLTIFSNMKSTYDLYVDSSMPKITLGVEPIRTAFFGLKAQGVKIRMITNVTNDNLREVKELMSIGQIRHLDGVIGNMAIADKTLCAGSGEIENGVVTNLVVTNASSFVKQHQYFFETLWEKAIPAKQRIKEIEEGAKREFIETIRDPYEIQKLGFDIVKRAKEEIVIIFSTSNAFHHQARAGALQLLQQAAARKVKIRVLVPPMDKKIEQMQKQLKGLGIDIRDNKKPLQTKVTTLVVDKALSLTVELKDDSKETSEEATGLATFSNSETTVMAYISIFENMWMQTELNH